VLERISKAGGARYDCAALFPRLRFEHPDVRAVIVTGGLSNGVEIHHCEYGLLPLTATAGGDFSPDARMPCPPDLAQRGFR
jgi:hypothetical protein